MTLEPHVRIALSAAVLIYLQLIAVRLAHDFDFLIGDWKAHVRRLPDRLSGSTQWIEYDGISRHKKILDSNANFEEFEVNGREKGQEDYKGAGNPGSLCLERYFTAVGAHGTVILGGRWKELGGQLDLRAVAIAIYRAFDRGRRLAHRHFDDSAGIRDCTLRTSHVIGEYIDAALHDCIAQIFFAHIERKLQKAYQIEAESPELEHVVGWSGSAR
jgi:hypothetical protein